jgi:uncharacterized protein (DUF1501 family)
MFKPTRRGFMVGCSAAIATWSSGLSFTAFGAAEAEPNQDIILVIFLRGGMDGLNVVMPLAGDDRGHYEAKRPRLAVPATGTGAALPLNDFFGLHPGAAALHGLFQDNKLAIVHAAGLTSDTRSHFDAMQFMELGTPDSKSSTTGWLTRHLQSASSLPGQIIMPAVAVGNLQPTSLLSSRESIGMTNPNDFNFGGNWRYADAQRQALRTMYDGASWLHQAGIQTLNAIDVIESANPGSYTPGNGAVYPTTSFGRSLQTVAQVIRMQLGLRVATIDLGGWDTHESQGDGSGGYFSGKLDELGRGIEAFLLDLNNDNGVDHTSRITVVVMSEFGRSFQENASRGTDHGHGNVLLVAGGAVNGGQVYGEWPGLATDQLYDRRDLAITTDYRRVLSEILIRRLENPNLGSVFPGYQGYEPLGIVQGVDIEPDYSAVVPQPTPAGARIFLPAIQR